MKQRSRKLKKHGGMAPEFDAQSPHVITRSSKRRSINSILMSDEEDDVQRVQVRCLMPQYLHCVCCRAEVPPSTHSTAHNLQQWVRSMHICCTGHVDPSVSCDCNALTIALSLCLSSKTYFVSSIFVSTLIHYKLLKCCWAAAGSHEQQG